MKDHSKEYEKVMKEAARSRDELVKLLDTEFDDEGNEIEDDEDLDEDYEPSTIKISMPPIRAPHVEETPAPEKPKPKGSCLICLLCIVFIISIGYTIIKFVSKLELHVIPLSISLISAAIVVIYGRIVR